MSDVSVALAGSERIDELKALWLALHQHHRVIAAVPLVVDDEASWQRRRALYLDKLDGGCAFLLIAERTGRAVGYALTVIHDGPDDTFPVGDRYAEVYSLSVLDAERGDGIGTRLLDAVDAELVRRGVVDLVIGVIAGNDRARRLYERRGLVAGEVYLYRLGSA